MSRLLLILLFGLSSGVHAGDAAPARVVEDHGFVDLDIPIERVIEDHGIVRLFARGYVDGGNIGLEVDFPLPRKTSTAGASLISFGTARIQSTGADSDRFVRFLCKKYQISTCTQTMIKTVDAASAGLGDSGADALHGRKDLKFFFYADGPEDRYAELYVNVDFDHRTLEIHEKDADYRKGVILALTKGP